MSKLFSALSKPAGGRVQSRWQSGLLALALVLGGCQAQQAEQQTGPVIGGGKTITAVDTKVDTIPTSEPGYVQRSWRADNRLANELTGNLSGAHLQNGRGTPLTLAFANGMTLRLEQVGFQYGREASASQGRSFADVMGAHPEAFVYVYRVISENLAPIAQGRGLCAPRPTTFVAVSEFVDSNNRWTLRVASFGGQSSPNPQGPDPGLCGVFHYAAA